MARQESSRKATTACISSLKKDSILLIVFIAIIRSIERFTEIIMKTQTQLFLEKLEITFDWEEKNKLIKEFEIYLSSLDGKEQQEANSFLKVELEKGFLNLGQSLEKAETYLQSLQKGKVS